MVLQGEHMVFLLGTFNVGYNISDHFAGVSKMVPLGSGAERELDDFTLTRYACYLVAQNGDPKKEEMKRLLVSDDKIEE